MPREIECQHIAEVAAMLRHFFVDISVEYFCLMTERIRAEGMLGVEGKCDVLHDHSTIAGRWSESDRIVAVDTCGRGQNPFLVSTAKTAFPLNPSICR